MLDLFLKYEVQSQLKGKNLVALNSANGPVGLKEKVLLLWINESIQSTGGNGD